MNCASVIVEFASSLKSEKICEYVNKCKNINFYTQYTTGSDYFIISDSTVTRKNRVGTVLKLKKK